MPNRSRHSCSHNESVASAALRRLAKRAGFRLGKGLGDRVAYRELFLFGLTHTDLRRIPKLARVKAFARREIDQLLADLRLPLDYGEQASLFPLNDNGSAGKPNGLALPA